VKLSVIAGVLTLAAPAYALDPRFGAERQLVLSSDATTGMSYQSAFGSDARSFGLTISPSVDFFVVRNFSIGAGFDVSFQSSQSGDTQATTFGGGVRGRVGVNVPLGRWISWWPQAQIRFEASHVGVGTVDETIAGPTVGVYAPILLQLRTHFFIGFGPAISHTFDNVQSKGTSSNDDLTTVSIQTVLGGTIGGENESTDDARVERPRFGERRELVLAAVGELGWNGDQTVGAWSASASASAEIDYFVARHFSLGIGAGAGFGHNDFKPTPYDDWSASIRPEIGWDVPISESFSFYPRVSLGFGVSARTEPATTTFVMDVGAYAPVLFHFAPQVFVGFGPSLDAIVFQAEQPSVAVDPRSASIGASLSVGGWL
jgi:hypothetical protein